MKRKLLQLISQSKEAQDIVANYNRKQGCLCTGLADTIKATFISALDDSLKKQGSLVFLVNGRDEIREYTQTLAYFYPEYLIQELYPVNLPRVYAETKNLEIRAARASAFKIMAGEEIGIVFITAESLMQKQISKTNLENAAITISTGEQIERTKFIDELVGLGYERTDEVETIGHFSVRGEILDIFPLNTDNPIRIEWFDAEIDNIRVFDIKTKRSIETVETLKINPINIEESGDYEGFIFDYLAKATKIIFDEPAKLYETIKHLYKEGKDYQKELWTQDDIFSQAEKHPLWVVSALGHHYFKDLEQINIPVRPATSYNKNTDLLVNDLLAMLEENTTPLLMMSTANKGRGIVDSLKNKGVKAIYNDSEDLVTDAVNVFSGDLFNGFRFWNENWLLLTENNIFGMQKRRRFASKNKGQQLQYFTDIKAGDYVVHTIHGIGRYIGVENVVVDGLHRDYLLLNYAGDDKLYVPVDQVTLLHRYVGSEGTAPKLSKMGGADWSRKKSKASAAITELAEELLRLYANRKVVEGHAFSRDSEWQAEFEDKFPYEETPDQLKAINEIKTDMESSMPMERLLCGDVGYGKTEVAIRAAFKAVLDNKQVAVLVPTTVLAQQHYLTFKDRMESFGVRIEALSRFCTTADAKRIIDDLETGNVDIVIGTHRLLQADVVFKDLGLLVIDEEQRFGVVQKEKIKKWKTGIDVLALSATPIPRTLHMALVNGRDMSVIESPPEDRMPVETYVAEYDDGMIKEAIERELRRGGRIYYVHNRVSSLNVIAERLRKLVPGINIKIAHGKMNEDLLEDAMIAFYEGKCDVLLCTTIIENGLDVPLANTIIIDGAENFGLSQLYQMRGRVGRSSRLAYAYFTYRKNKVLSEIASKRLQAIRNFTELGAGFKIAMRDLEIRGAGNLLGSQQHGFIAGIGFAAYCDILEKTITRLKNGMVNSEPEVDPVIEIPLNAYIPDSYISDPRYKLELYRKFVDLEYRNGEDLIDEIIDRFGTPPEEVELLWRVAKVRALARLMKIKGINVRHGEIRISFLENANVNPQAVIALLEANKHDMIFRGSGEQQLIFKTTNLEQEPLEWLEETLPKIR